MFFRFEDTAELTHNCKLACTATAAPLQGMIFKYQSWKVWFYDIYLSNISKNKISKFSNDRIWTYEVVTLNLEFNWFDRSQTLLFAFSIFVVETVTIFGDIL